LLHELTASDTGTPATVRPTRRSTASNAPPGTIASRPTTLTLGTDNGSAFTAGPFREHLSAREMSGAKLRGSAGPMASAALALDLLGPDGIASATAACEWQTLFLTSPSMSIRGGTDEIQRNVIGGRVLDLPPEPRADGDVPFWQLPRTAR
jgi:alkylation response protein AidB-like acyl-CoA dehydrogenase